MFTLFTTAVALVFLVSIAAAVIVNVADVRSFA